MKNLSQFATAIALVLTMAACTTAGSGQGARTTSNGTIAEGATNPVPDAAPERSRALYMTLIASMAAEGKHHAALAYLDDFDTRWPNDAAAISLRADQHMALGELRSAALHYQQLRSFGGDHQADAGLGRVAGSLGKWNRAINYLESAVRQQPANASYLNNLGYAYLKQNQPAKARRLLERAYEIEPKNHQVRNNLMVAMTLTGDQDQVREALAHMPEHDRTKLVRLIRSFTQNG